MRIPNFFIVGKPKSGTTALHSMLQQHPDIFMSAIKEPNHFAVDHIRESERRNRGYKGLPYKDRESYLKLFEEAGTQKIIGESSTGYLYSTRAAEEIAKFNPHAKILMILREPVDFLYSFHSQLTRSGNENVGDFRKALELEEPRKKGKRIPSTTSNPRILFYSEQARYCEQVERFIAAFDKSQVKIVIYDDFRENNLAVCEEVFEFLGVDAGFVPERRTVNRTREVRALKLAHWLIYHGERKKGSFKETCPKWIVAPIAWVMRKVVFSQKAHAPLDDRMVRELKRKLRPEVSRLSALVGRDLVSEWQY